MKTTSAVFALLFLAIAIPVCAQDSTATDIALTRAEIQAERRTIVGEALALSPEQGKVFWPLYQEYRTQLDVPLNHMWTLLLTYADRWSTMNNADASKLLNEWLAVENDMTQIKQKFARKMAKDVDGVTAARFFQIDNKLDTIIRLEAATGIPIIVRSN